MSKEADLSFLKKVAEDDGLHEKFKALVAESGYEFSVEELTDDELDQAAGGGISLEDTTSPVVVKVEDLTSIAVKLDPATLLAIKVKLFP